MTKTLKDLFEVYKPKSPDEQKFVDKHVTIKHKDRNGNDDDVFKGNTKYIKRKEERHGYDVGDDEKVYEEVEEIEELSQKMVRAYRDKARDDKDDAEDDREFYKAHDDNTDAEDKKIRKRTAGIQMASKKLHGGAKVGVKEEAELEEKKLTPAEMKKREEVAKAIERENPKMPMAKKMAIATATAKKVAEEVEELDELSKSTLGSYAKKAMKDAPEKDRMGKAFSDMAADDAKRGEREGASYYGKRAAQSYTKAANRRAGVEKAIDKLTKEEYEELEESAKVAAHLIKRYGENVRKSHVRSAANDFGVGYVALSHAVRKKLGVNRLEEEQIDEISAEMKGRYKKSAQRSLDQAQDFKSELDHEGEPKNSRVRKDVNRIIKNRTMGMKRANEEVQIDEISTKLALDYTDKASDARGHRNLSTPKLDKRYKSMALAHEKIRARHAKVPTTEEVEQVDELSRKTLGSYAYKATNQVGEKGITAGLKIQNNEPAGKELKTMGKRQRGVAMAVKKLTKEEIINRAIDKYMPELEDYVPMTQEEKLIAKLEHLPEAHVLMLLGLYENLNEDNRTKMMSAVDTREGINSLIDFAIQNRGE